jgi:hypothetical protein
LRILSTFKCAVAGAFASMFGAVIASITVFQQARFSGMSPTREVVLSTIVTDQRFNGLMQAADRASHACVVAFSDSLQITMALATRMLVVSCLSLGLFVLIALAERAKRVV